MKPDCILMRLGEIALKSEQVNRNWTNVLKSNIKYGLKDLKYSMKQERNRFYIFTEQIDDVSEILKKIFGIVSLSKCYTCESEINKIKKLAVEIGKKIIKKNDSFAISAKRVNYAKLTSQDIACKTGEAVLNATKSKVDLSNPDKTIFIEVRNDATYIFTEKEKCAGGLPLGVSGKVLCIVNDRKSLLSAWLLMKRGCSVAFIGKKKYLDILRRWHIGRKIDMIKDIKQSRLNAVCGKKIKNKLFLDPSVGFSDKKLTRLYEYIIK